MDQLSLFAPADFTVPQPLVVAERVIAQPSMVAERMTNQQLGDAAEFAFACLVTERGGHYQKASTDAQPHDAWVQFGDRGQRVQIKATQTLRPGGYYAVDLGAHRIGVEAFVVMLRHHNAWRPPFIVPAPTLRKRRQIHVWSGWHRTRRGEFSIASWANAWHVLAPEYTQTRT